MMHLLIASSVLCFGDFDFSYYNFDGNNGFSFSVTLGKEQARLSFDGAGTYPPPPTIPDSDNNGESSKGNNFSNGGGSGEGKPPAKGNDLSNQISSATRLWQLNTFDTNLTFSPGALDDVRDSRFDNRIQESAPRKKKWYDNDDEDEDEGFFERFFGNIIDSLFEGIFDATLGNLFRSDPDGSGRSRARPLKLPFSEYDHVNWQLEIGRFSDHANPWGSLGLDIELSQEELAPWVYIGSGYGGGKLKAEALESSPGVENGNESFWLRGGIGARWQIDDTTSLNLGYMRSNLDSSDRFAGSDGLKAAIRISF